MTGKSYPSDVSDKEWAFAVSYLILMAGDAPQREHSLREMSNAASCMSMAFRISSHNAVHPIHPRKRFATEMNENYRTNTALEPTPKLEEDAYDWWQRHRDVLDVKAQLAPEIVLIGDSITHFWGGAPASDLVNGARAWEETFRQCPVLNLGFGWDRTQNVLWRLDHGEFDGLQPRTVVLNIGTNNFTATANARANSSEEVAEAIFAICERVRCRCAQSRIVVMGVFPRWQYPGDPGRRPIERLNALLENELAARESVTFLDIGAQLLEPDGTISSEIMGDFCHPTEKGYRIWGSALRKLDVVDV